jgi:hypothetical protein
MFIKNKPNFLSETMLHKDYDCKGSVGGKKVSGRDPQRV